MVLPKNPFFTGLGVVGILGGDAFAQSVVTFDSRSKIMVINYPYRPEGLKVTDGIPLLDETDHHSIVNVRLGTMTSRFCSIQVREAFCFILQKIMKGCLTFRKLLTMDMVS